MAGGFPNVKHLWIQDPSGIGDPAVVNESTPEYPGQVGKVGGLKESAGSRTKFLQYVKRVSTDTTVAAAAGAIAYWQDDNDFVVCADQTLALGGSTAPVPAGVFLGTLPAAGNYGLIQVTGTANLLADGVQAADIVVGQPLYLAAGDADGKVTHPTVATDNAEAQLLVVLQQKVGVALAAQADSSGSVAVLLDLPHNGW